jgi:hypothetical protein
MLISSTISAKAKKRSGERGAALITALLVSMLLLIAGGALIMTTALSATNANDAAAETQAYYAAEAGLQATLNVLRGNVAPSPLFNTSSASAAENKITFRQAVATPDLSRWLTYNTSYSPARVTISDSYTPLNGMAYSVTVSDPDNMGTAIFRVTGSFPQNGNNSSITIGTTNSDRATITYTPPTTNPSTVNLSGDRPFGSFQISAHNQFSSNTISTSYPDGIDFNLTITQTSPYPSSTTSPTTLVIPCKITGVISSTSGSNTVQLAITPPATDPASTTNYLAGVRYSRTTNTFPIAFTGTTTITPVTVTAPDPRRLLVRVRGFGPRGAEKRMQLLISRFSFDYTANAAITLRGADSTSAATVQIGNSSQYRYSGYDNAGGPGLPAFAVTNGVDNTTLSAITLGNTQVTGTSQVQQLSASSLATFLQTAQGARDAVELLREASKNQFWPVGTAGESNDRYFPSGTSPSSFGTEANPLFTFVDGDAALPPAGGAGLLVVTGTLDMRGNADFKGLILVLGAGEVIRNGGGNGLTLGSILVARFGATGDFLAPTFDSNGGGTSDVFYDSRWVERALLMAGPRSLGVSEY